MDDQLVPILEDTKELFVFGYGCKVFRDDDKAKWVENGNHLIPWMGDSSLQIDRYDCRGALTDLKSHEAPSVEPRLSQEDKETERICDLERYRDFREEQEFDDTAYQEEEFRRLQLAVSGISNVSGNVQGYAAVEYSYNDNKEKVVETAQMGPEPKKLKENRPYVKPPGLFPPPDVYLPITMKSHAIIEKTAKFIAGQDGQMEIILKTKQAKNPQFEFLNFSDLLNPYYKFLVTAIQTCAYQPSEEISISPEDSPSQDSGSDDDGTSESSGSYLHPSLAQNNTSMSTLISKSMYKPTTTHSAYSMLVSKIKKVTTTPATQSPPVSPYPPIGESTSGIVNLGLNSIDVQLAANKEKQMLLPQEQIVIEKMANYVIKNGPAFESLANHKGDPRFMFLDPKHPLHWYYLSCKERIQIEAGAVVASGQFVGYRGTSYNSHSTTTGTNLTDLSGLHATTAHQTPLKNTKPIPPSMPPPNHANALNRMATLPPELISKIEELRKKTLLNRMKNAAAGNVTAAFVSPSPDSNDLVTSTSASPHLKAKREQVIKFSSALSQRILGEPESSCSELELFEYQVYNGNKSDQPSTPVAEDSEEVRQRKEGRRKKAALFLQQLKVKKMLADSKQDLQPGELEKTQDEKENQESEAELIPSPVLRRTDGTEPTSTKQNHHDSTLHETSIGQVEVDLRQPKPDIGILERFKESITPEDVSMEGATGGNEEPRRSKKRKLDRKHKHIRRTSLLRSPSVPPPISEVEHSSPPSHKKRSKSKHKKRRKKHEKSHKKSKRDKYE